LLYSSCGGFVFGAGYFLPGFANRSDGVKLYTLRRELTWSHYRLIMRVDNAEARAYYIRGAAEQTWCTRHLERNIQSNYSARP